MNTNFLQEEFKLYFEKLEKLCGQFIEPCLNGNLPPYMGVNRVALNPTLNREYEKIYPKLLNFVKKFWAKNAVKVNTLIKTLPGLKASLGGDIGPHYKDTSISGAGIYYDTVLIEDPLMKILNLPSNFKNKDGLTLKYLIELFLLKDYFLSDVKPPIALLYDGSFYQVPQKVRDAHLNLANIEMKAFLNNALGTNFSETWEFRDFFRIFLKSPKDFAKHVKTPKAFYFGESDSDSIEAQIEEHIRLTHDNLDVSKTFFSDATDTETVIIQVFSYFATFLDLSYRAKLLGSELLIPDSPALHWYLENLKLFETELTKEIGEEISFSLPSTNHLLNQNFWLTNVSPNELVNIRKLDGLKTIREKIFSGVKDLAASTFSDYSKKCNEIDLKLSLALNEHQEKLKEINSKTFDQSVVSTSEIIVPTIAFLKPSILGSFADFGLFLGTIAGTIKFKDFVKILLEHVRAKEKLSRSPIGILWKAKKK